jgi:hypothetical protein
MFVFATPKEEWLAPVATHRLLLLLGGNGMVGIWRSAPVAAHDVLLSGRGGQVGSVRAGGQPQSLRTVVLPSGRGGQVGAAGDQPQSLRMGPSQFSVAGP